MDKLKKVLRRGGDEENPQNPEEPGVLERANEATTLAWGTRVKGFLVCFFVGAFCTLLATFMMWIPGFGLAVFIIFYTVGNVSILASTLFLVGPCRQIKSMCAKERAVATILMLVCLVLTLCSVYLLNNFTLALIFCLLQVLAYIWYGLSYLPFVREGILKCFSIFCG